jgi:hypothetical protein
VVVAQHHVGHVREVDPHLAGVGEDGVGPIAGVEEQAVAVHLDECGEAPLADALVGQHGGQDDDAQFLDAWPRVCAGSGDESGRAERSRDAESEGEDGGQGGRGIAGHGKRISKKRGGPIEPSPS